MSIVFKDNKILTINNKLINVKRNNKLKNLLNYTKSLKNAFRENTIIVDLSDYIEFDDTENVTDMSYGFYNCISLQNFHLLDTSKVKNLSYGFYGCTALNFIANIETGEVTNFSYMCYGCTSLITFPSINTTKGKNFSYMCYGCTSLIDFPQIDTSNATNLSYMLYNCAITSLPQLNTVLASNLNYMLYGCNKLVDLPQINTIKTSTIAYMCANCYKLEKIDLTYYNISSTNSSQQAFANCYSLKTIIIRSFGSNYVLSSDTFSGCYHLVGTANATYNPEGKKDGYIYTPRNMVNTLKSASNWSKFADQIKAIYSVDKFGDGTFNENINENNETILIATANEGNTFVGWYNGIVVYNLILKEIVPTTYEELDITYKFTLNANGYYQNSNQNKDNTYSMGRFRFNIENAHQKLKITYLQSSENGYDYGVVGKVDVALGKDTTDTGYTNFKSQSVTTDKELLISDIAIGEHFIDIKYKKDGSQLSGTDTFQVKVEVVSYDTEPTLEGELYSIESEINIGVVNEQTMNPLNLVAVFEGVNE